MDTNSFLPNTPNAESEPVSDAIPDKSVQRRRTFSREQKRRIVQDVLSSGESFSIAARRHNVNTNLLFKWRQQYEQGRFEGVLEILCQSTNLTMRGLTHERRVRF